MANMPAIPQIFQAIDIYLRLAYDGHQPSQAVRGRVETLRSLTGDAFFNNPNIEHDAAKHCLRIRLGNLWYPHMKLSMDLRPDGQGYLFRADTHDRHCCPPVGSREYPQFVQLMDRNQRLAEAIEAAWEAAGIPTFKTFLRQDLARRLAEESAGVTE